MMPQAGDTASTRGSQLRAKVLVSGRCSFVEVLGGGSVLRLGFESQQFRVLKWVEDAGGSPG